LGDGRAGFGGGAGVVFGELLGRGDAALVALVHGGVGFLFEIGSLYVQFLGRAGRRP
jgi:hypothetical protein